MQLLVVVDMQEDFVRGALTVPGAEEIIPGIKAKVEDHLIKDDIVLFTRDTHYSKSAPTKYLYKTQGKENICLCIVKNLQRDGKFVKNLNLS